MNIRTPAAKLAAAALLVMLTGCSGGTPKDGATAGATPAATSTAGGGVAAVSQYDSGPRAFETPVNASLVEQGEGLFKTKGCSACHAFGQKLTGPDLAGVTQRRTASWMASQILHPEVMTKSDPISHEMFAKFALQMPNQGLNEEQAKAVIEYFKHKDQESGAKK